MGLLEAGIGRAGRRAVDARVVDEDVEAAGIGAEVARGARNALLAGDVELDDGDPAALRLDLARLPLPGRAVAGADQDIVPEPGELASDLAPDAAVRTADQRDRLIAQILFLCSSFLPITMRWISEVPSPIKSSGASR